MRHLEGKRAIVTGGAAGLGRAIVLRLAAEGAQVGVLDLDGDAAAAVAQEVGGVALPCDVSDRDAVIAATDRFAGQGGLDILVNNAVYFFYAKLAETPPEQIHRVIDVGLKGALFVMQAATPQLIARGGGSVVNLSSVAVTFSIPNAAVYTSVKGAIDALTRQQAVELAPHDIRVNALAPGPVSTPGANSVIDAEGWKRRAAKVPLGRLTTPEEVAGTAAFLCGPDARSISGVTIRIDGAMTVAGP